MKQKQFGRDWTDGDLKFPEHLTAKMKLKKKKETKFQKFLVLQLSGWKKNLIFLDFLNGRNHC